MEHNKRTAVSACTHGPERRFCVDFPTEHEAIFSLNDKARLLSGYVALTQFAIALALWWNLGGFGSSPAWQVLHTLVADAVWPALFLVGGLLGLWGSVRLHWLRLAFRFNGVLMLVWAVASFWAVSQGFGSALPGGLLLVKVAGLDFIVASWSLREQRVVATETKLVELGDKVEEVVRERAGI